MHTLFNSTSKYFHSSSCIQYFDSIELYKIVHLEAFPSHVYEYKALKTCTCNQSFEMIWFGNTIILTLALVSKVDGRTMFSEPMAYTSLFGQMPDLDFFQDEKDHKGTIEVFHILTRFTHSIFSDLLPKKDDGLWIDLGNLKIVLDFKEMRQLQLHETLNGHARRLRPGYSSTIW